MAIAKQSPMKGAKHLIQAVALVGVVGALCAPALSQAKSVICVWDVVGKTGDVYAASTDYALAMQKQGVDFDIKTYVDERVAVEDFRAG
ncbi:MAG TPA: hypothetical protein VFH49_11105, partial [Aquabacterium sp.]|nr:hypothetical protein [Aquabacterium sp.]